MKPFRGIKSQPHLEHVNGKPIGPDWDEHENELDQALTGFVEIKHSPRCFESSISLRPTTICADDCAVKAARAHIKAQYENELRLGLRAPSKQRKKNMI